MLDQAEHLGILAFQSKVCLADSAGVSREV
jgi:hypothetical protein